MLAIAFAAGMEWRARGERNWPWGSEKHGTEQHSIGTAAAEATRARACAHVRHSQRATLRLVQGAI